MADNSEYIKALTEALNAKAEWLEKNELPKMKDEFRLYHTGFASLYNLYLKKGLIHEDPYKQEAKIGELEVPNSAPFSEAERMDQLTRRLANYDNQLDFLVNFYQFSPDFLTLDRIKRIVGLVKYIDWQHLTPDAQSPVTRAVAEMTNQIKIGTEPLTMSVISESLVHLNKCNTPIMAYLKSLTDYQREAYKLDLRDVLAAMSQSDVANLSAVKKKFQQTKPGVPFYPDLVDEVIKEDYSKDGPSLREDVLKKLQVAENKPKKEKAPVSFKSFLVEGIQGLGGTANTLTEIAGKIDENQVLLEHKKKTFGQMVKKIVQQIFNREPDAVIYNVEYMDPVKAVRVQEKVNYQNFRGEIDRKIKTLLPMSARGNVAGKLEA